jgi:hypothetical protein
MHLAYVLPRVLVGALSSFFVPDIQRATKHRLSAVTTIPFWEENKYNIVFSYSKDTRAALISSSDGIFLLLATDLNCSHSCGWRSENSSMHEAKAWIEVELAAMPCLHHDNNNYAMNWLRPWLPERCFGLACGMPAA